MQILQLYSRRQMLKVLITGFEPFGKHKENSSWSVAERLAVCNIDGVEIAIEQMPVSFARVGDALRASVRKHVPAMLIMLGQASTSEKIRLERIAINMMDSKNADNDGFVPNEEPICKEGEAALFTNMPIKKLCSAIEKEGIGIVISNSCGLYVCNRIYYEALRMCKEQPAMQTIFVHLPLYKEQPSAKQENPTMPINEMVKAIQIIIEQTLKN